MNINFNKIITKYTESQGVYLPSLPDKSKINRIKTPNVPGTNLLVFTPNSVTNTLTSLEPNQDYVFDLNTIPVNRAIIGGDNYIH